jgi:hypothetical protein
VLWTNTLAYFVAVGDDEKKSFLTSDGRKGSSFPLLSGFVNQVRFVIFAPKNGAKKMAPKIYFFFFTF